MLPSGRFAARPQEDLAIVRTKSQWLLLAAGLIFAFTLVLWVPSAWQAWLIMAGIYTVAALGLHIMTGLCGQFSMGQAAFMAVGAYTSAILTTRYGLSPWLTLPLSGLSAGLIGLVFALPAARIKGFYLVMSTIAAQFIIIWALGQWSWGGGLAGTEVPQITVSGKGLTYVQYWWLTLAIVVVVIYLAKNIQRTTTGRSFIAVRDNDLAAEVMGINLFRTKLLAFFIGCFFAGIAGWLWAHFFFYITPGQFAFKTSLWLLGMIIIGGMGSTAGAVMGVVVIRFMDKMVDRISPMVIEAFPQWSGQISAALALIVFAAVVLFFIMIEPKGVYHRVQRIILYYRLYPFSYQSGAKGA
jgi:branched-chain amino acid transport system permease protein